jgi:hypothetical protein
MESGHFGTTPTTLVNAMLTAYQALLISNGGKKAGGAGTGCVASVNRIYDETAEGITAGCAPGVPAILVFLKGGVYESSDTTMQRFEDLLTFRVICVSGALGSLADRLDKGERDSDEAFVPGVEELQDWGVYLGARALNAAGAKQVKLVNHSQAFRLTPERFAGAVTITAKRYLNIYDDALATTFERLGIVHDPTDPADLWEVDNITPKSDWPTTTDGGVATL